MNIKRTYAIFKKEVKQLIRDKKLLFVLFFFPLFLLIIFGYAVDYDVKNVNIAVFDESNTEESLDYIKAFSSSEYFNITRFVKSSSEINSLLDNGDVQAVVVFDKDFAQKMYSGKVSPEVQIIIDGLNGNTAAIIKNYVEHAIYEFGKKAQTKVLLKRGIQSYFPIEMESRFLFNPELTTTKYLIPGLIGFILIITAIVSVSLSFVKEKEAGTMEQLNVSAIKIFELVVGKSLPFLIISFVNAIFILSAGYILFGVVVHGSYLLLFVTTLLFLSVSISAGIFFSIVADTQQVAFTLSTFFSLLPSVILSGFVFPIESMPWFVKWLTNITPAKFYLVALRAIIIRGVGLEAFWTQWIYILLFGLVFSGLSVVVGKKKISAG